MKLKLSVLFFIAAFNMAFAQKDTFEKPTNKGKFFTYWGWNRGSYTNSDITFRGDDYRFTLSDVKAVDKQVPFSVDKYLNPVNITLPQTNFRLGYFFKENYTISLGVDHMKYVMVNDQTVDFEGAIDSSYGFAPIDGQMELTTDFLLFEHTDGLNYISVEVNRFDNISALLGLYSKNLQVNITEGLAAGVMLPKTNSTLMGKERYDDFHISGFGLSAQVGLDITFLKHFFIMTEFKGGYINMGDIRTTLETSDSASQSFWYAQKTLVVGGRFRLF